MSNKLHFIDMLLLLLILMYLFIIINVYKYSSLLILSNRLLFIITKYYLCILYL